MRGSPGGGPGLYDQPTAPAGLSAVEALTHRRVPAAGGALTSWEHTGRAQQLDGAAQVGQVTQIEVRRPEFGERWDVD